MNTFEGIFGRMIKQAEELRSKLAGGWLGGSVANLLRPPSILLPEMPPTIFRCGKCGEVVARYDPAGATRKYRVPPGEPFTCKTHGALQDVQFDEWEAEWERRGRPARLNWRLPPMQ